MMTIFERVRTTIFERVSVSGDRRIGDASIEKAVRGRDVTSPAPRAAAFQVRDLLATRFNVVRVELTEPAGLGDTRFGRVALFGPLLLVGLLVVGYLLILVGAVRVLVSGNNWGAALFALGALHVALGLGGLVLGSGRARISRTPILEPVVTPDVSASREDTVADVLREPELAGELPAPRRGALFGERARQMRPTGT